jgi:hypothetical protein
MRFVMPPWLKKGLWVAVGLFVLVYVISQPEQAANIVKGFFGWVSNLFTFFTSLAS